MASPCSNEPGGGGASGGGIDFSEPYGHMAVPTGGRYPDEACDCPVNGQFLFSSVFCPEDDAILLLKWLLDPYELWILWSSVPVCHVQDKICWSCSCG